MNVMVPVPDHFVARFGSEAEFGRHVLELLGLEEFRAGRLGRAELRTFLGFATRAKLDAFLKEHGITDPVSLADIEHDLRDVAGACG